VIPWIEELQPASFRGVAFSVSTARAAFGRRNVLHEYPLRDLPFAEDLGRRARAFRIAGFVIGDNAKAARDRLVAACEAEGPGALIHPSLGEIDVVCNRLDIAETEQGRIFRFTLDLSEAGTRSAPQSSADSRSGVLDLIDAELDAVVAAIDAALEVAGLPEYVIGEAAGFVGRFVGVVQSIRPRAIADRFNSRLDGLLALLGLDTVTGRISTDTAAAAITSGIAVGTIFDVVDALGAESDPAVISERASALVAIDAGDTPEPQAAALIAPLHGAVQAAGLTEIARATTSVEFASQDAAEDHRDQVRDLFDDGLTGAAVRADDVAFAYLGRLSAAALVDIAERGASLAPMMDWDAPRPRPSLSAAWGLYGDPDRDGEMVDQLSARHPLFLPTGGKVLAR